MDLLDELKQTKLNLLTLFTTNKLDEIKSGLNEIINNPEGYNELKNNLTAYNNFFNVLSHIYLTEQNRLQNSIKADNDVELSSIQIDKDFEEKVNELANDQTSFSLSR